MIPLLASLLIGAAVHVGSKLLLGGAKNAPETPSSTGTAPKPSTFQSLFNGAAATRATAVASSPTTTPGLPADRTRPAILAGPARGAATPELIQTAAAAYRRIEAP